MAFDFHIPTAGGAYHLPQPPTLDFWIRDLVGGAPVVSPATFTLAEDAAIGAVLGTIDGTDPDDDALTWSITAGNVGSAFEIDPETGELTVAAALDYNERSSYSLTVRATDGSGLWGAATITIAITSTAPVITPASFSIGEFADLGDVVGTVYAVDPNGDDFVWSISSGNTGGAFAIDPDTGVITVAAELDFETKDQYQLVVLATDTTGRYSSATIVIDIIDEIEVWLPPAPALIQGLRAPWLGTMQPLDSETALPWRDNRPLDLQRAAAWARLRRLDAETALRWQQLGRTDAQSALPWAGRMSSADAGMTLPWGRMQPLDVARGLPWDGAMQALDTPLDLPWRDYAVRDLGVAVLFTSTDVHAPQGAWVSAPVDVQSGADIAISWPRPGLDFHVRLTDPYALPQATLDFTIPDIGPYEAAPPVDVRWAPYRAPSLQPHVVDAELRVVWGGGHFLDKSTGFTSDSLTELPGSGVELPWDNDPDDFEQIVVPPLKVYNVMNNVSVVRLPERTPINPISLSIEYDDSNFCWTGTLVLFSETEAALLAPTPTTKRLVEVSVNGFVAVLFVETRARERKHPSKRWTMKCKGRQAMLDAPYVATRSLISDTLASASQLAIAELPSGWTLTWDAVDWNIPAGGWSYNGLSPLRAIARLAQAVGAVLVPDPEDQALTVRSRYPISPTQWYTSTPEISLPDALCTTMGDSDVPQPVYDQVIVEGSRAPAVRVVGTRAGTDGGRPMASITEELCYSSGIGQERARVELDATGSYVGQTIAIPIIDTLGVVLPGKLVELNEGDIAWRALTRAVSITAGRVEQGWGVGQIVKIERREAA